MDTQTQVALIGALGPIVLVVVKHLLDKKSKSHDKHGSNNSRKQRSCGKT
ncbi:MAG: hypothetical protein ACK4EY_00975 [Flavipsychrobacter sp.]